MCTDKRFIFGFWINGIEKNTLKHPNVGSGQLCKEPFFYILNPKPIIVSVVASKEELNTMRRVI